MARITDYLSSLDPVSASKLEGKQRISEIKYDTLTVPAGALAFQTPFFTAANPGDPANKNFEQNSQLVSGGKYFLIQWIAVNIITNSAAATFQDVVNLINNTALQLQVDQKIMGRFPTHALVGIGGLVTPSGQISVTAAAAPAGAASPTGALSGNGQNQPYRINPILIEPLKQFTATLLGPSTALTQTGTVTIRVALGGLQFQAIQ